jgi:glutathione peroxidase
MESDITDIFVRDIKGRELKLAEYLGKILLVVNVASKCGLTPQYAGLESLYTKYRDRGLVVLGFPSNEFGSQEPGSNPEILDFCTSTYGVNFPMFEKIVVKGQGRHPLYSRLTGAAPTAIKRPDSVLEEKLREHGLLSGEPSDIKWNFEKFLVDRSGKVAARFAPDVDPLDPLIIAALEKQLGLEQ